MDRIFNSYNSYIYAVLRITTSLHSYFINSSAHPTHQVCSSVSQLIVFSHGYNFKLYTNQNIVTPPPSCTDSSHNLAQYESLKSAPTSVPTYLLTISCLIQSQWATEVQPLPKDKKRSLASSKIRHAWILFI